MRGAHLEFRLTRVLVLSIAVVAMTSGGLEATATRPKSQTDAHDPTAQVDLRDVIARILDREAPDDPNSRPAAETTGDSRLFLFPTLGGNPALGFAVGIVSSLTDYWGDPTATRLPLLNVSASFSTRKQMLLVARSDVYAARDEWHLTGDWRYYKFLERTHGLGSNSPVASARDINYDWLRLHETVYRPVWAGLFLALNEAF